MRAEKLLPARATELPAARYVFAAVVVLLLAVAAGHWVLLAGLTDLYLGLPLWLWLHLGVVAVMLVLAWVGVTVWTAASGSTRRRTEES